jgi:hypothetical protein
MEEAKNSITELIRNRLTNQLYGTFFLSWLIFHWNFVFSIFALDDTKILISTGLLKNDYLIHKYFNFNSPYFYFSWVMPFIFTYLIIWKLPKWILIPAYQKGKEYEAEKRIIKNQEEMKVRVVIRKLEEENVKIAKVMTEKVEEEQKIKEADPTIGWDEEFFNFKQNQNYFQFRNIVDNFYSGNGGEINNGKVSSYLDSLGLINLADGNPNYIKTFTEKGKYFIRKMNEPGIINQAR